MDGFDNIGSKCDKTKKKIILIIFLLLIFSILFCSCTPLKTVFEYSKSDPKVIATVSGNKQSSMVVIEQSSRRILSSQNMNLPMEIASTTKIVTALIVLENLDINKEITISKQAVGVEGSSIYLRAGEVWTVKDLLHGLMLRSGNDSAVALAIATAGSVQKFCELMNKKTKDLGLVNTNFCNPNGLHAQNHYSSAYDMAMLSAEAMNNATFRGIVNTKTYKTSQNSTHPQVVWGNKNKMLSIYEGGNGIKTGYTKMSGRCLVSSATRNGMQLICVVLNHGNMWQDSMAFMDSCFKSYCPISLGKGEDVLWKLPCKNSELGIALQNDLVYPIKNGESMNFDFKIDMDKNIKFPITKTQKIGKINIYNDNRLIFSQNIISMNDIQDKGVLGSLNNFVGVLQVDNNNGKTKQIFGVKRSSIA